MLIIAGIEGFQIDGFQRAVGGGFPNKPIGAIRLLLAGAKVKAVAAQNGVNGILIPVGDEKAMTENINRLIEDEELREGLAGEALHIRERINGQAILQQWKEYIEEVLK